MYLPSEGQLGHTEPTRHDDPLINGHDIEKDVEPIAIVGYAFRFPEDAVDDQQFWNMMMEKRCVSSDAPTDRWNVAGWHHPDKRRRGQVRDPTSNTTRTRENFLTFTSLRPKEVTF